MTDKYPHTAKVNAQVRGGIEIFSIRARIEGSKIVSRDGRVFDLLTGERDGDVDERISFSWHDGTSARLRELHLRAISEHDAAHETPSDGLQKEELERAVIDLARMLRHRKEGPSQTKRNVRKRLYKAVDALEAFEKATNAPEDIATNEPGGSRPPRKRGPNAR